MDDLSQEHTRRDLLDLGPTSSSENLPRTKPADIRIATMADLKFVDSMQHKYKNCLGYLTTVALTWYLERGRVLIVNENSDAAGMMLGAAKLRWQPLLRPIYQAAVAMDAQRRHHALDLLTTIEAQAIAAGQLGIQANCAADLEANQFWKAAGFKPIVFMTPNTSRRREIICWRKLLTNKVPLWMALPPQRAGHRAKTPVSERERYHVEQNPADRCNTPGHHQALLAIRG